MPQFIPLSLGEAAQLEGGWLYIETVQGVAMQSRRGALAVLQALRGLASPRPLPEPAATAWLPCLSSKEGRRAASSSSGGSGVTTADLGGPLGFVLDIDGVLIRGKKVLPGVQRALAKLYSPDGSRPLYPLCFCTNGGGMLEIQKAHQLSEWLGVEVGAHQVVLSHTPFRELVPQYRDQPVLVAGRGHVEDVARSYGFKKVVSVKQLRQAMPSAVPFIFHRDHEAREGPDMEDVPAYRSKLLFGTPEEAIRAVLVFSDPNDWYVALQLLTDVNMSCGAPGHSPPPGAPPVEFIFSNPDLLWANDFPTPRFGQGAFAAALDCLAEKLTGQPLPLKRVYGKPHAPTYRLLEKLLLEQAVDLGLELPAHAQAGADAAQLGSYPQQRRSPFGAIWAVGDNPASDVRGANAAGAPWVSVLVKTGVAAGDDPADPAQLVVDDLEAAVDAALHRARSSKWHSMR